MNHAFKIKVNNYESGKFARGQQAGSALRERLEPRRQPVHKGKPGRLANNKRITIERGKRGHGRVKLKFKAILKECHIKVSKFTQLHLQDESQIAAGHLRRGVGPPH